MEPTVFLGLSAATFLATLLAVSLRSSRGVTDVVVLFGMVFGLFYGFRGMLLALGLDTPYPDRYFELSTAATLTATTLLWLTLFLLCFGVGVHVTGERVKIKTTLFFAKRKPPTGRLIAVTLALTAVATVISMLLTVRFGGIGGFIRAVKIDKDLAGYYFLKVPAAIGAFCAVAAFLQLRQSTAVAARRLAVMILACALLDGFWVFIWGQRSTLVILGVMLLIGTMSGRERKLTPATALAFIVLAAVIVGSVSLGLRVARDELVAGEVQDTVAGASVARQVSVATNSIYFDSSLLAFRDWPSAHPYRLGEDFALGAAGFVPRIVWAGKPRTVKAGAWFRQVYQPKVINGWPVGAPTLWWLNFGPLGIALGGLITGFVFGFLRQAQRNSARSGLNVGIALVTSVYVFQTGVGPEWPVYFTFWLAPLWVIVWFLSLGTPSELDEVGDGPPRTTEVSGGGAVPEAISRPA